MQSPVPAANMTGKFALFADCLLVGVLTTVAAIPVVTAYPALVAACSVMRSRVRYERNVGVRPFLRCLRDIVRSGRSILVVPPLVLLLFGLDGIAVAAGVPGSRALALPLAVIACATLGLGLRAAARWRPGSSWRAVLAAAAHDGSGAALLALAGVAAAAIAVIVPITTPLIAGPLALAAVAVDARQP